MGKKKVLVTGLNGVVGSALRPSFEEKYELSSFSRYVCDDGFRLFAVWPLSHRYFSGIVDFGDPFSK